MEDAYRDAQCAFCNGLPSGSCERCRAPRCEGHRSKKVPWCAACEDERRDALELAIAEAGLRTPEMGEFEEGPGDEIGPPSSTASIGGTLAMLRNVATLVGNISRWGLSLLTEPFRKREARRLAQAAFDAESPEEIQARRRTRSMRA
jgi:hypothetical protein